MSLIWLWIEKWEFWRFLLYSCFVVIEGGVLFGGDWIYFFLLFSFVVCSIWWLWYMLFGEIWWWWCILLVFVFLVIVGVVSVLWEWCMLCLEWVLWFFWIVICCFLVYYLWWFLRWVSMVNGLFGLDWLLFWLFGFLVFWGGGLGYWLWSVISGIVSSSFFFISFVSVMCFLVISNGFRLVGNVLVCFLFYINIRLMLVVIFCCIGFR